MPIMDKASIILTRVINKASRVNLADDDLSFSTPREPKNDTEIDDSGGKKYHTRATANQGAPARGSIAVYFDRVNFQTLFSNPDGVNPVNIPVDFEEATSTHKVLVQFNLFFAQALTEDDVEDLPVENNRVIFRAKPTSLGWEGEFIATLVKGYPLLEYDYTNREVAGFTYPHFNTRLGQAAVYSYPYVLDAYGSELKTAGLNLQLPRLAVILKAITGHQWQVFRNPTNYNLLESSIIYNGPNISAYPTNSTFDNVLVVELSLYCTNLGGRMYLHYNDPV